MKIKMGQMQYEKQRKEHKLQSLKVGFSQGECGACCMIMVFDLSLWLVLFILTPQEWHPKLFSLILNALFLQCDVILLCCMFSLFNSAIKVNPES